jgi:hypothetical protein
MLLIHSAKKGGMHSHSAKLHNLVTIMIIKKNKKQTTTENTPKQTLEAKN